MLALLVLCLGAHAGHDAVHLQQADLLELPGGSFQSSPWSEVSEADLPGEWQPVSLPYQVPRELTASLEDGETVTRWFRMRVESQDELPGEYLLYLPRWQTVGRLSVYADGQLVFHSRGSPVWNAFNMPLWLPLNPADATSPPRELLIRVVSLKGMGLGLSTAWVGQRDTLIWRHRLRDAIQVQIPRMSSAAFLAVGLFSLAVWMVRRKETAYALFFVSSALFYLRCMHYYSGDRFLLVPDAWFGWITLNSLGWLLVTVYFFAMRLQGRRLSWPGAAIAVTMSLTSLATLPPVAAAIGMVLPTPAAYGVQLVVMVVATLSALWSSWRSRVGHAMLISGWGFINLPVGLHDWLLQSQRIDIEQVYLLPYTGIGLFLLFMTVVFRRYVGALADVESANQRLEARLVERENELARSHERLREIERGQMLVQERQRLMQDMHDGLGSSLMSALHAVELGQLTDADVAQVLRECIDDLKLAIDSLEPVQADLLLLMATLRFRLAPRLQGSGMRLDWAVEDLPALPWLEPRSALHILRIFQEVFTNIIKHAQATEVRVGTSFDDTHVVVTIDDNGRGFAPDAEQLSAAQQGRANGKGLGNLLRRARHLHGQVQWHRLEKGTRFELRLPRDGAEPSGLSPVPAPRPA